ncbi:hypothetical protein [Endozoicomonas numazuensis]|uniref:CMP/dCMP-type deaminase domain-containing protein n=1 Tax=Endozoicomonas numazuensis TaxID=1137799 RepID=A0A081NCG1_9GAMM|nr:hypothetical protein [Endozoicomonas numazuensis]KEQ16134.1 hypothetical protein GZ78_23000 [Endozoicomonas numazuensis]
MQEYEEMMGELIELGINANPVAPFSCCILDPCGQILVTAAYARHISPLFSAEGLALHALVQNYHVRRDQELILLTNAEPECAAMSTILWCKMHDINIAKIVFGASRSQLRELWGCTFGFESREILERADTDSEFRPEMIGPILADDCLEAFEDAKALLDQGDRPVLSMDLDDFWLPGDWMLELED